MYQNQVGYADFRKKTPLNSESVFQLASVSKQFTATAIMQLKEKSKLKKKTIYILFTYLHIRAPI